MGPALKECKNYNGHNTGIHMKQKELTKTFMLILSFKNTLVSMVYKSFWFQLCNIVAICRCTQAAWLMRTVLFTHQPSTPTSRRGTLTICWPLAPPCQTFTPFPGNGTVTGRTDKKRTWKVSALSKLKASQWHRFTMCQSNSWNLHDASKHCILDSFPNYKAL